MAGNGGIIGVCNGVTAASCLAAKTTAILATGTFAVQCAACGGARTGSVLVVGGGGSGGAQAGGGGGGGGFRMLSCQTFPTSPITVTIGGGAPGVGPAACGGPAGEVPGAVGTDSVFAATPNPITATRGGAGIHQSNNITIGQGGSGGGGTNATCATEVDSNGNTPATTPSQGNPGGTGMGPPRTILGQNGGGGGGAGGTGTDANPPGANAGPGGAGGDATPVFGAAPQPFYNPNNGLYAGGGGGCYDSNNASYPGAGGPGGGTNGVGPGNSSAAGANTGSGSGGGNNGPGGAGGSGGGGSGIILVKECAVSISASASGMWQMNTVYNFVKAGTWI
jgi:hypothetical protein|tara:strand:- start:136 stop:1143 length:1008 start_codon:yes stop_codon:yes gene_type:complete